MGFSSQTKEFGLPQYVLSDVPQMEDFNKAFKTISENLGKGGNVDSVNGKTGVVVLSTKDVGAANKIINTASGAIIAVNDASVQTLEGLTLYGKTTQDGTPTPEEPVELVNAGASGSVAVNVKGKNLWEFGDKTFTKNFDIKTSIPAGTYTITAMVESTDTDDAMSNMGFYIPNTQKFTYAAFQRNIKTSQKKTLEYPATLIRLNAATSLSASEGDTATWSGIQLEVGDTATEYEPYISGGAVTVSTPNGLAGIPVDSGGNYTDESGQEWICDEVDFAKGVTIQRVKTVIVDSIDTKSTIGTNIFVVTFLDCLPMTYEESYMLCSAYGRANVAGSLIPNYHASLQAGNSNNSYFRFRDDRFNTIKEVNAWLNENPFIIAYPLAEPIETPLTADELAQYAALHTNKPNTTILNNGGAGMMANYTADTKIYIDKKFEALTAAIAAVENNEI